MDPQRLILAHHVLRIATAILFGIHGFFRAYTGGVVPFGGWLEAQGFPYGIAFAWAVTGWEMLASLALLSNRFVVWACLGEAFIITMGIVMVHAPEGWFVVGGGRNGVEYSVLLLVSLFAVAWPHMKKRRRIFG